MPDDRDRLLTLDRKGLEAEARRLGLTVAGSMSRAELITQIERHYALQELGELRAFGEHRFLIMGLFFVAFATFVLALDTLYELSPGTNALAPILVPIYLVFRSLGGFLISAALFSLGLKVGHWNITPAMRAAFILGAVLVVISVFMFIPLPKDWAAP
jgi:hypothetical protein